jgi:hypothetical protein
MPTHLVARAVFDRLAASHGTRDVYRLLRAGQAVAPLSQVYEDIARFRGALVERPQLGAVAERYQAMREPDLVKEALRMFKGYHSRPVVEREGETLHAHDLTLLFYYQNRTAHVVLGSS